MSRRDDTRRSRLECPTRSKARAGRDELFVRGGSRVLVAATAFLSLACLTTDPARAVSSDALRALENTRGVLGVVVPCQDVAIASEIGGVLASVNVRVGDRVRPGQILFRLDDTDLLHRVEVARAGVQSAQADVARARAALEVAELAKGRRERGGDVFTDEERERATGEAKVAAAGLESSVAKVGELTAELSRWENDLRRSKVRAPFGGAIAARYLDAGTTVAPTTPVVRIVADRCVLLRFAVPPESLDVFREGSTAEVVFAGVETPLRARVRSIAPQVDPAIDLVLVEAEFELAEPASGLPRPGLLCRVRSGR